LKLTWLRNTAWMRQFRETRAALARQPKWIWCASGVVSVLFVVRSLLGLILEAVLAFLAAFLLLTLGRLVLRWLGRTERRDAAWSEGDGPDGATWK
jgi:hypothetical protein